jgi:dGTPase
MDPSRAFLDGVLKYKTLWSELKTINGCCPKNHFLYDSQFTELNWAMGEIDFPPELTPGDLRDGFKSIECQIMDWADDTAYSLNDLSDSVKAGFLTVERIEQWALSHGLDYSDHTPLGDLLGAIRGKRIEPFIGKKIGKFVRSVHLEKEVNLLSATSHRYAFRLMIDEEVREESSLFKALAYELVFLSPQLKQLEYKGSHILGRLWELLERRYVLQQSVDGQKFQLLPHEEASEIDGTADKGERARLVCDFLAGMTDGYAVRTYSRLFEPGYGSIGDLVG